MGNRRRLRQAAAVGSSAGLGGSLALQGLQQGARAFAVPGRGGEQREDARFALQKGSSSSSSNTSPHAVPQNSIVVSAPLQFASTAPQTVNSGRVASAASAVVALSCARRLQSGRRPRNLRGVRRNGLLKGIQDFFSQTFAKDGAAKRGPTNGMRQNFEAKRIVVTSSSATGQPFCGEYLEQTATLNSRPVFKKIGLPPGSQDVYLLYNTAQQWAFTPHSDGRADGWVFAADMAREPAEIKNAFSIWDGKYWVQDPTLKVVSSAKVAADKAAADTQEPAVFSADAAGSQADGEAVAGSPTPAGEQVNPQALLVEPTRLPTEAEDLAMMQWASHWDVAQKCLVSWPPPPANFVDRPLPSHQGVKRGVLSNGLRYIMMENAMPPGRLEAHIELHVGSIDEEPHEQGIAHMMEHVCFLGSRKRERLIGTGSRSNALTDFQHTIYHIHTPVQLEDGTRMYLPALEALHEIAFAPEMLPHRIEKERKAVLAEMQQVNDMEYRIETWTLSGLHETNKLGSQFPIGKEEQIKKWQQKDLRAFHEKWYYPGNATLYVVGDMKEEDMLKGIKKVFEPAPARHEDESGAVMEPVWGEGSADARSLFRRKIGRARPEQLHNFSVPMIGTGDLFTGAAAFQPGDHPWHGPLRIFRNELLEGLQVNFYAKAPVRPLRTLEDIRHLVAVRILIGVLQFRIVSRYSSNHAPVQIDHSDSFREGCAVTSITVNADPRDWRNALACVVQEIRAICDYGITESEMKRYMAAMLKDVEKGVAENDTVPSEDHLNFVMTSDVFDHVIMHPQQSYDAFKEVEPFVTREWVQLVAKWMLGFVGYYGQAAAPPPTAIVVCTPARIFEEHTGTWAPFDITEAEIVELLLTVPDKSREDALNQVDVPDSLLKGHLDKLLSNNPVDAFTAWRATSRKHDSETGVVQSMLPNGARVNYVCTTNESQGTMRILVPGGRSADTPDEFGASMVGIRTVSESGAVSDYCREQIELFAVSNLMSVHLDLNLEFSYIDATFNVTDNGLVAVLELLHLLFLEPRWELPAFVRAQQAYKAQAYAVQKSLEQSTTDRLMRMMYVKDLHVSEPRIEDLNKLTLAKVRRAVSAQLRPQDLEINLVADFDGRSQHKLASVESGLSTGKHRPEEGEEDEEVVMEAPAVRERKLNELDNDLWKYLGSIPHSDVPQAKIDNPPLIQNGSSLSSEEREKRAHLEDSDERAVANIGGGAPNRWGKGDSYHASVMEKRGFSWDAPNSEVKDHPLYPSMCLLAMREVINTRLFSTVRDSLGLSYDCSFDLSMLDRLEAGYYTCTVSAHPSRIGDAVAAAKGVLSGVKKRPISELELATARRTLIRRHETDVQTNEYWISLLTHLQYDNPKDISCIRDIEMVLKKLTWRDVQNAYQALLADEDQLFVSISTAGPGASYVAGGAAPAAVSSSGDATTAAKKELVELD